MAKGTACSGRRVPSPRLGAVGVVGGGPQVEVVVEDVGAGHLARSLVIVADLEQYAELLVAPGRGPPELHEVLTDGPLEVDPAPRRRIVPGNEMELRIIDGER